MNIIHPIQIDTKLDAKTKLTLYIGASCPFCMKVLHFMDINDISIPVKDVWSDDIAMNELVHLTGKTQVPCLKINSKGLLESNDIIQYLTSEFLKS